MTTGTDDRKEMTSTTQVPLSVEGLADWLRSYANYCDPVGGIRQVDVIRAWASAVESLAAGRIAGQADEAGDLSWEHRERVLAAPQAAGMTGVEIEEIAARIGSLSLNATRLHKLDGDTTTIFNSNGLIEFARAILSARKDRAEALLREADSQLLDWLETQQDVTWQTDQGQWSGGPGNMVRELVAAAMKREAKEQKP